MLLVHYYMIIRRTHKFISFKVTFTLLDEENYKCKKGKLYVILT